MPKKTVLFVIFTVLAVLLLSTTAGAQGSIPRGGTFVVSEGQQAAFTSNFNPYAPDPTRWTQGTMYELLILYNPVEGGAYTPWLATGYEWSDDLLTLTFTMNPDAKWNDGTPLTAEDVVFTFNMIKANPAMDRGAILSFIDSAEVVDGKVQFNLSQVYTLAPEVIGGNLYIVPAHAWADVEDPVTFTNPPPVVASGMLTDVKAVNEQVLEICRNPNYWQMGEDGLPLPYVNCMRMPVYPGNDPANLAAVNGELDWIGNFIADIDATFVAANPEKHHYYFWPGGGPVSLYMNTTKAPFNDVNFRAALSAAIDYEAVTSIGMYGYTEPINPTGLGPRWANWINPEAEALAAEMGLGKYNPELAAAKLDDAGYMDANGDGWRDLPDGGDLRFKVQVVNGWTDWVTSVQIMSQNFQDVGLNAVIDVLDFGVWFANLQNGTFDTSIGWGSGGNTPYDHFRNLMYSGLIGADGLANAQLWGRWTSPEADALIDAFTKTADEAEWRDISNKLQMIAVENVVTVPLFPGPTWYEWTTHRFTGFPTREDYYTQGSPWQVQGRTITLTRIHCLPDVPGACD